MSCFSLWGLCTPAQRLALRNLVANHASEGMPIGARDGHVDPRTAKGLIRNHVAELRGDPNTSRLYPTANGLREVYTFWPELKPKENT